MKFAFGFLLAIIATSSYSLESRSLVYGNIGVGYLQSSSNIFKDEAALQIMGGAQLTENIAAEGIYGIGLKDDVDNALNIDSYYGLQVRFGSYISPSVYPFALVGINTVKFENIDSDSNAAIGVGVAIDLGKNHSLRSELKRITSDDTVDLTVFNTGLEFYF